MVNGILFTQAGQDAPPTGVGASAWRGKMPRLRVTVVHSGQDAPPTNGPLTPFLLDN